MKKYKQKEELQTRREFFKSAAKKTLPIVAAIALVNVSETSRAVESTPMGCNSNCQVMCAVDCRTGCRGGCSDHCAKSCSESCYLGCKGGCKNGQNIN